MACTFAERFRSTNRRSWPSKSQQDVIAGFAAEEGLGIMVIRNFINLNICQPVMLLKNFAHLGGNRANVTLMEAAQMECASKMVYLINTNVTLISQSSINILTEILEVGN